MKLNVACAAMALFLCVGAVAISDDKTITTTEESTTIQGEVVRVDAGKEIVLRKDDGQVVTYMLTPEVSVPAEVEVGKVVVLHTDKPASKTVTRVTTTSVGPFTKRVEETTTGDAGTFDTQTVYTVQGFVPGRSLTVVGPSGKVMTINVDAQSDVPADIAIGKTVTIQTEQVEGRPLARRVVYSKKTTTTEVED